MKITEEELTSITSLVETLNSEDGQEAFVDITLHIEIRDINDSAVLGYVLIDDNGIYNYHPEDVS